MIGIKTRSDAWEKISRGGTKDRDVLCKIIQHVAHKTGHSESAILSNRRFERLMIARQIAIYMARKHCKLNDEEIGIFFQRDRSSISYAYLRVCDEVQIYPERKSFIEQLEKELGF